MRDEEFDIGLFLSLLCFFVAGGVIIWIWVNP